LGHFTKNEENLVDTMNGVELGSVRFDGCTPDVCVWLKDIVTCFCWPVRI
jgi:hypothetical protein